MTAGGAPRVGPAGLSTAVKTQKNHVVYKTILNLIHLFFVMLDRVERVVKFRPVVTPVKKMIKYKFNLQLVIWQIHLIEWNRRAC